jgi:ribosomal protein S27AE
MKLDKYDKLASQSVRKKWLKCRNCGRTGSLNAHHIMPRSRSSTRYLLENLLVICPLCHVFGPDSVHRSPTGSKKFCIRIIGAKEYRRLEKLSLKYKNRKQAQKEFLEKYKSNSK